MAALKTKADKLAGVLEDLTVEALDEKLRKLGREWDRHYTIRQMLAREEGNASPPPSPPKAEAETSTGLADNRKSDTQAVAGNLARLVNCYRDDKRSSYRTLRYRTRLHYDGLIKRIVEQCGDTALSNLDSQSIQNFYNDWSDGGSKIATGRAMMTMLRMLINFGATVLEDSECERLSGAMRRLKFENSAPRNKQLSAEQATNIREQAHKMGVPSIALAQAFQFDCKLSQRDVIGEWVPLSEQGSSEIIVENKKWLRGLRWSEIDDNLVLKHVVSRQQEEIEFDLHAAPMVMAELNRNRVRSSPEPIIVSERSGFPWTAIEFRRTWRKIARAAGVPDDVFNMDTSGGTIAPPSDEKIRRLHRRDTK